MSRYTAEALDLSRLPPFQLIDADYETIIDERLAGLARRLEDAGIDYDVGGLQSDPLVIDQQESAYREQLVRQALNDAGWGMTLAGATGPQLDQLAATYFADIGVRRLAGEDDDRFKRRISLAPEAKSPGSLGGYEYRALSVSLGVSDALALNHASGVTSPGEIRIQLVFAPDADGPALLAAVRADILDRDRRPASDEVTILAATPVVYDVAATIYVPRGPDPELVRAEALRRLGAYAEERRRAGRLVALSGLDAALHAPGAERVQRSSPAADVDPGPTGVAVIGQITLQVEPALV